MTRATEVDCLPPPIETKCGDYVYFTKRSNDGALVYYRRLADRAAESMPEQVLLDSGKLARDQGYALRSLLISDDNQCMACLAAKTGKHDGGSESSSLLVYALGNVGAPKLVETLEGVFNFVFGASGTLFYTVLDDKLRASKVMGHITGHCQSKDIVVFDEPCHECFVDITRTKDRQFHIINSSKLDSSEVHVFPSSHNFWQQSLRDANMQALRLVRPRQPGVEYFVDHHDGEFVILTNSPTDDGPALAKAGPLPFRLVRAPTASPTSEFWTELLSVGSDELIEDVEIFRRYIMVSMKSQGRPAVYIYDRVSGRRAELPLPYGGNCTVRPEPNPQLEAATVRLGFSSPVHLESVVEYDMSSMSQRKSWASTPLHINSSEYIVRRLKVPCGGVDVPMTLIHHESTELSKA
ncbi:hypothetical protein GGF44_002923 [Coemansia sp. RSA 1694]|nr:hypothetical protein GGF44_002923 [Coemansia sp. RSA 1694]